MVLDWMMTAVSPRVRDLLSVVIVRVTLHEVSPNAMAIAVATATARYFIAATSRCFCVSVSFIGLMVFYYLLCPSGQEILLISFYSLRSPAYSVIHYHR